MSQTRRIALLVSTFALCAAVPARVQAQDDNMGPSRISIEPYLAQYSLAGGGGSFGDDRVNIGGVGVRAMLGRGDVTGTLDNFFRRAKAGLFFTYTASQEGFSTQHLGGQADFPIFAAPVASGYVDPFISLGLGGFRFSTDNEAGETVSETNFALTPAIGALFPLTGAIKFRGDIRDAIIFGDETTNNFLFEGGISIGF